VADIALPNVKAATDRALEWLAESRGGETWVIRGEPTAGKTAALESIFRSLIGHENLIPIMVAPPPGAPDSGPIALLQIAERLRAAEVIDAASLDELLDPTRQWQKKRERVRGWLNDNRSSVVMLCDEPLVWPADSEFGRHARNIWSFAFDGVRCRTISGGDAPYWAEVADEYVLEPASVGAEVLETLLNTEVGAAARQLDETFSGSLEAFSPLQIRLLVAVAAIDPTAVRRMAATGHVRTNEIVRLLIERLERDEALAPLRTAWSRLAEVREPFDRELLSVVEPADLTDVQRTILERCLLFEREGRLVLHERLRALAATDAYVRDPTLHGTLADYYKARFASRSDDELRLRDSVEAFHHASIAGIHDDDRFKPFFLEQWSILGYYLSYHRRQYESAVRAFREALRWEPEDAYANHYLAYNLDVLAENPEEVETHYRRAIERDSTGNAWYHARLINFLLALSRVDDARSAWIDALDELVTPDASVRQSLYFDLHLHVARMLLYRGELDFASSVLERVPAVVRAEGVFQQIQLRLLALKEARDFGSFVPGWLLRPQWWKQQPNLLRPTWAGKPLREWLAGEVDDVDTEHKEVWLSVAYVTEEVQAGKLDRPIVGSTSYTYDELHRWWSFAGQPADLRPGDFVEIGFYGAEGDSDTVVAMHSERTWIDLAYPGAEPDPDRYALVK
jgi:tetratricopeptide (TPR) repeat protein